MALDIKGKRLTAAEQKKLGTEAARLYGKGDSIREVARKLGRSYGWAHRTIADQGDLRPRGGQKR